MLVTTPISPPIESAAATHLFTYAPIISPRPFLPLTTAATIVMSDLSFSPNLHGDTFTTVDHPSYSPTSNCQDTSNLEFASQSIYQECLNGTDSYTQASRACNFAEIITEDTDTSEEEDIDEIPELTEVTESEDSDDEQGYTYNENGSESSDDESEVDENDDDYAQDSSSESDYGYESEDDDFPDYVDNYKHASLFTTEYSASYPTEEEINWEEDIVIFPTENAPSTSDIDKPMVESFTAYKKAAQKVHPVSGTFPESARVRRSIPYDPLETLPPLSTTPPEFIPTSRLTEERMKGLNVNHEGFLLPEEEKLFQHILKLNEEALPFEEADRGTLKKEYFSDYIMPTVPHTPWAFKSIPIPAGIRDKVISLLKDKMSAGVYEASQSSYRGRWFCVLKKNGSLRIVHDLQPLNKVSIRDAGQIPVLDEFVESYGGRQCYTVFDLFWGFDARIVDPSSRDMTTFQTPLGLLRLTSLPMGYTNSPAEFQRCMEWILQEEIPDPANIFIDDLPIKGPRTQYPDEDGNPETLKDNPGIRRFIWEHANDVHRIMHRIKCAGGTFSPKKTQICRPNVVIVGQKCTPEGRLPDDDRVTKIQNWPILQTVKEVRGFLGLCGTVRVWIKDYSALARPLTELIRKDAAFVWTERRQNSFDTLKSLVASAPALHPIDYTSDQPLILSVDTSKIAVGFILSQVDKNGRRRPARYGSIPINERESRYSQPKLELFGLYRALRAWRFYLVGAKNLVIEMDASCVEGIINNPTMQPNDAMNRWIQGVLLFDFTLKHVPAEKFKGPDGLSRRHPAEDESITSDDDSWLDEIALLSTAAHAYPEEAPHFDFSTPVPLPYTVYFLPSHQPELSRAEQRLIDIRQFLITKEIPRKPSIAETKRFLKSTTDYFLKQIEGKDVMYRHNGNRGPLVVIFKHPKRIAILTQAHEDLGHKGENAVFQLVRMRFYWPSMRLDVHHHVASCHECQIRNTKRMEVPVTISTPSSIFQKVYIDVMYMPPSGGKHLIVAAKDDLTGVTEVKALSSNTSENIATFFKEQILYRYGAVAQVTTDNGPEVKGAFQSLMKKHGIPHIMISPYNKHANGVVERGHYIFREALVKSCKKNNQGKAKNWEKKMSLATFADRVTVNSVTGYSPYFLLHSEHPLLPFDLFEATFLVEDFQKGMTSSQLLALRIRQLEKHDKDVERAAEVLQLSRLRSKEQFNRRYAHRLQKSTYLPGSLVLVRNTRLEMELNKFKLDPRYLGPYEVVRQTFRGTYVLKELDGTELKEHYAAFRIIAYIRRDDPILMETQDNGKGHEEAGQEFRVGQPSPQPGTASSSSAEGFEDPSPSESESSEEAENLIITIDRIEESASQIPGFITTMEESDFIISINPQSMIDLIAGETVLDLRDFRLPTGICQIWLLETGSVNAITHIAICTISPNLGQPFDPLSPTEGGPECETGQLEPPKIFSLANPILQIDHSELINWDLEEPLVPSTEFASQFTEIGVFQVN